MRRITTRHWIIGALLVALVALTACGGGGDTGATNGGDANGNGGNGGDAGAVSLEIGSEGEQLAFNKTELRVEAGQEVTLTFNNNSASQQHNWILVDGGDDIASEVNQAAQQAGPDNDYLPDSDQILANTALLNGGESETITFTAPEEPGEYSYLCTFPGHYQAGMKGTLIVE